MKEPPDIFLHLKIVIVVVVSIFLLCGFVWLLVGALFGIPIHDVRLWMLENNFKTTALQYHPRESMLIEKKKYLGGPQEHGSLVCDIYVGELRAAPLSKEKIRAAYRSGEKSFEILFPDEGGWTMESPLGDWWDEWHDSSILATSSTVYFVFIARKNYPDLGDFRCDD
jgi:hypothetical protein